MSISHLVQADSCYVTSLRTLESLGRHILDIHTTQVEYCVNSLYMLSSPGQAAGNAGRAPSPREGAASAAKEALCRQHVIV